MYVCISIHPFTWINSKSYACIVTITNVRTMSVFGLDSGCWANRSNSSSYVVPSPTGICSINPHSCGLAAFLPLLCSILLLALYSASRPFLFSVVLLLLLLPVGEGTTCVLHTQYAMSDNVQLACQQGLSLSFNERESEKDNSFSTL